MLRHVRFPQFDSAQFRFVFISLHGLIGNHMMRLKFTVLGKRHFQRSFGKKKNSDTQRARTSNLWMTGL